eukprot:m.74765 g.74765  ORF g.74765 m.74765 type:complete len:247 (+) comp11818_c1_seq5:830-1570(+)
MDCVCISATQWHHHIRKLFLFVYVFACCLRVYVLFPCLLYSQLVHFFNDVCVFRLDCLVEIWMLVGCHPSSLVSPYRAPSRQLQYWQKLPLQAVLHDMEEFRQAVNNRNMQYVAYCVHPSFLSSNLLEKHIKDLHRKDPSDVVDFAKATVLSLALSPSVINSIGTVVVNGRPYRCVRDSNHFFRSMAVSASLHAQENISLKEVTNLMDKANLSGKMKVFADKLKTKLELVYLSEVASIPQKPNNQL